jgi:Enoyl-CoA hydratase/isomerase
MHTGSAMRLIASREMVAATFRALRHHRPASSVSSTVHATNAALVQHAIALGAPKSIAAIPANADDVLSAAGNVGAVIRPIGCSRRVFLQQPYLTGEETAGLAYRIQALTKNDGINSVLIATDDVENPEALPSLLLARNTMSQTIDFGFPPAPGLTYFVAGGYDPVELFWAARKNPDAFEQMLDGLCDLTLATAGSAKTKVPVIFMPHGAVQDGGAAFCRAAYVIATRESTFAIRHPTRGLALDPVGLSYTLPRLGQEFNQISKFVPVGLMLALTGYQADAFDMVETGLATDYADSANGLSLFEQTLGEIRPWKDQALILRRTRTNLRSKRPIPQHGRGRRCALFCLLPSQRIFSLDAGYLQPGR